MQNDIRLLDESVRFGRTLESDTPDVPRARVLNGALSTERLCDGNSRGIRQRFEFGGRARINDTATSDDERFLRRTQNLRDRAHILGLGLRAANLPVVRFKELDGVVVSV